MKLLIFLFDIVATLDGLHKAISLHRVSHKEGIERVAPLLNWTEAAISYYIKGIPIKGIPIIRMKLLFYYLLDLE